MENEQEHQEDQERLGFMGGLAGVLNSGGSAVVYAYDVTSSAVGKLFSVARKAPIIPTRTFEAVVGRGWGLVKPGEAGKIEERIKAYKKKIKELYYEIGKEGASHKDIEDPLQTESVQKLISGVREYEKEIERLQDRMNAIEEERKQRAHLKKEKRAAPKMEAQEAKPRHEQVLKSVTAAVEKGAKKGVFESASERAIFEKVAADLLDSEVEIKCLAAAELGKMGNRAAVPILIEAAAFNLADLSSEIINSLISIGAAEAVPLFQEKINDPNYRVRIGCLRGLFKLAGDDDAIPVLTEALRDQQPEVRRTAATFIGWKDCAEAVPALVQCLRDKDARVRKAGVTAIANIKDDSSVPALLRVLGDKELEIREKALEAIRMISGEEISFDVHASGNKLSQAIDDLRNWWQERRLGELDVKEPAEPDIETPFRDAAAEETEGAEEAETPEEPEAEGAEEAETPEEPEAESAEEAEIPEEPEAEAAEEIEEPETVSAEPETAAAEEEKVPAEPETETNAEEPGTPDQPQYTQEKLMRMVKAELLSICEQLGIESAETLTKAQIVERILGADK